METFLALTFIAAFGFGALSCVVGSARGIDGVASFFLGFLLGPIGLLIAALMSPPASAAASSSTSASVARHPAVMEAAIPPTAHDVPDALSKLADLYERGALTDAEFADAKASILKQI